MGKVEGGCMTGWEMWNVWFARLIPNSDSAIAMLRSNHMVLVLARLCLRHWLSPSVKRNSREKSGHIKYNGIDPN
ncbi:hypothetical protein FIBSPDRAFT_860425 [Athelia psychrophila]|uniref:Uncharacterized protein n=1 Tax=Athelia psychrophila TaxID=1759441 RepID=A0A166K3Y1_9AGAM|nr:hypothetical protein FIBSPDRAFT_860425 [Fibularhizoctonia sp. CBS 109695]